MVNFGEAGRICLNQERQGACENCLWWEWDAGRGECSNSHYHICPLHRERLFSLGIQAWSRGEAHFNRVRPLEPLSASDGLVGPPVAKVEESGTS
jgi:hypothetical protein